MQLGTYIEFDDMSTKRIYPAFNDRYMNLFLTDVCLRKSCYECRFKEVPKGYSDITIADFWGISNVESKLDDGKGTSLIIINSKHGKEIWDEVNESFIFEEVDLDVAVKKNQPLVKATEYRKERGLFFEDYKNKGFEYVKRKYGSTYSWMSYKISTIIQRNIHKLTQFIKFGMVGIFKYGYKFSSLLCRYYVGN